MKLMKQLATLGAVFAVVTLAVPTRAADDSTRSRNRHRDRSMHSTNTTESSTQSSDQSLGQVERANKLIGKEVQSSDNKKVGKIDEVIVDLESGHILYAVVGSGGVLGAGEKRHAVPPGAFTNASGNTLQLNVDQAKFNSSPEFS